MPLGPDRPLHVLLDARLRPGEQGGVQQATMGLAAGLSGLDVGDTFTFLVQGDPGWLDPHVGGPCRIVRTTFPARRQQRVLDLATRVGGRPARDAARVLLEAGPGPLPRPDPVVADQAPDVIHFLKHRGWRTTTPNAYVPHDLQHVDMPDHFSRLTRAYRRVVYGAMARQATAVVALTEAQRRPIAAHHRLPLDRVVTIGWASALAVYPDPPRPVAGLPPRYVLLPAKTWPHKRHDLLVRALGRLHADGVDVPAVLTGGRTEAWPRLEALAADLGVGHLLTHLGYVDEGQLKALYAGADALAFPTDYEGFGLPVVEAMAAGLPVVCSDIPVLRDLAGGAAAHFRAGDADDLAAQLAVVWQDRIRREALATAGRQRAAAFTWSAVAMSYRALYRRIAGLASTS